MDLGIKDQVAIVTGGGGGIGAATCVLLAREGVQVSVADLNLENAQKTADEIASFGGKSLAMQVDVSQPDQAEEMVKLVILSFQPQQGQLGLLPLHLKQKLLYRLSIVTLGLMAF